jgi:tRNA threonylcarbamoyladenosine biosynthesis protein TsaB
MEFYMLVLALDTTTRRGSAALARDAAMVDCEIGDVRLTHGERLPGDIMRLLERNRLRLREIDLFAVAAGPGSFTGLRVGIATMQGLALASGRGLIGVSTLDAMNRAVRMRDQEPFSHNFTKTTPDLVLVGVLMDAQRGEVFSALYRGDAVIDGPAVEAPADALERWKVQAAEPIAFVGDGALVYGDTIARVVPDARVLSDVPPLAPSIAMLAERQAVATGIPAPDAIRPIYVRRPDAELARDRTRSGRGPEPGTKHPVPGTTTKR